MAYKPREIKNGLSHKFHFSIAEGHSSDHKWLETRLPGLPAIITRVDHHKKEIGPKLEGKIARQLRVRKQFFRGMMDCTNSLEDYHEQVMTDPYPPWDVRF